VLDGEDDMMMIVDYIIMSQIAEVDEQAE